LPSSTTGTVATKLTVTNEYATTRNYLPKQDPYLVYRLVGFTEYTRALQLLDALVYQATKEELVAFDELVKAEPEFTVYTNLSRQLDQGQSRLVIQGQSASDDFARRGLCWVTALARVELGAMLAGFTDHPQPFVAVAGTGYDLQQYQELLLEGAKTHFWSFTRDPHLATLFKSFEPSTMTLAYVRRLNVANAFVAATIVIGGISPDSPAFAELSEYGGQLRAIRQKLQLQIQAYLAQKTTFKSGSRGDIKSSLVELCNSGICRQLDGK